MSVLTLRVVANIHQGVERDYQEDNFIIGTDPAQDDWKVNSEVYSPSAWGSMLVVADGMGGLNAGEVASQRAVEGFREHIAQIAQQPNTTPPIAQAQDLLVKAIKAANTKILHHAANNPDTQGMGTTIVVAWLVQDQMHVAWSGDSRCYHYADGRLKQVNFDHSYVQELVNKGDIKPEDAFFHPNKNIITQSLGDVGRDPAPDYRSIRLNAGDRVLLCSDGLNTMLTDEQISAHLTILDIRECATQLVNAANAAGGYDNITVVLAEVLAVDDTAPVPVPTEPAALVEAGGLPPATPGVTGNTMFKVTKSTAKMVFLGVIIVLLMVAIYFLSDAILSKPDIETTKPAKETPVDSTDIKKEKKTNEKTLDTSTIQKKFNEIKKDEDPPKNQVNNKYKEKEKFVKQQDSNFMKVQEDPYKDLKTSLEGAIDNTIGIENRYLKEIRDNIYNSALVCEKIELLRNSNLTVVLKVVKLVDTKKLCVKKPGSIGSVDNEKFDPIWEEVRRTQNEKVAVNQKKKWGIQLSAYKTEVNAIIFRDQSIREDANKVKPYGITLIKKKDDYAIIVTGFADRKEVDAKLDKLKKDLGRTKIFPVSYTQNQIVNN